MSTKQELLDELRQKISQLSVDDLKLIISLCPEGKDRRTGFLETYRGSGEYHHQLHVVTRGLTETIKAELGSRQSKSLPGDCG